MNSLINSKKYIDILSFTDITYSKMVVENLLIKCPKIKLFFDHCNDKSAYLKIIKKVNYSNINILKINKLKPIGFKFHDQSIFLFENPDKFFSTLTGISINSSSLDLHELLPLIQARLPEPLTRCFGSLFEPETIVDMDDFMPVELHLNDAQIAVNCTLWAQESAWEALLTIDQVEYTDEAAFRCSKFPIPIPMPFSIGTFLMTENQWKTIDVDDIIFLDKTSFNSEGVGEMAIHDFYYRVSVILQDDNIEFKVLSNTV